jgi:hypothetical protein
VKSDGKRLTFNGLYGVNIPEDSTLHNHLCEHLKSYIRDHLTKKMVPRILLHLKHTPSTTSISSDESERELLQTNHIVSQSFVDDEKFQCCCLLTLLVRPSHASTVQNTWTHCYSKNTAQPQTPLTRNEVGTLHRTRTLLKFGISHRNQVSIFICINSLKSNK